MSTEFKIEKGVPVAAPRARRNNYPFRQMNVGDSFFVASDKDVRKRDTLVHSANRAFGAGNYAVRKVDGGYRVWRLA